MTELDSELSQRLEALTNQGLYRLLRNVESSQSPHLEVDGRALLNFSSNDYLGLADHPALKEAAIHAIERYGAGAGASRLICGSLRPHRELDEQLAAFKGTESALSFATGYAAALGTIGAVLGPEDVIILDKLVHASIVDAARLCRAKLRVFRHNNPGDLEDILKWAATRTVTSPGTNRKPRILVVTETVFSMDGDLAPLPELVELKNRYGAWLMLDEAHATGLYGPQRRGLAEALELEDQVDIAMGTLGKAVGAAGGYICGSRILIDYLVNRSRSFIFSTAPVPAAAAAAAAGLRLVQSDAGKERCQALWERVSQFSKESARLGLPSETKPGDRRKSLQPTGPSQGFPSPIIPIRLGDENSAVKLAEALRDVGILVPAIRYPTVARGAARLRITLSAAHSAGEVTRLADALENQLPSPALHASPRQA